jgi:cell wall assembly regulator SMI1
MVQHRPRFVPALRPGADPAELHGLTSSFLRPVPQSLLTLLAWHNGQRSDVSGSFEGNWNLMTAGEIAQVKRRLDTDAPAGWNAGWFPFLDDDSGNMLCLDEGEAVHAFWAHVGTSTVFAPTLLDWLRDFVAALERGDYFEDPERGSFHRRRENS